MPLVPFFVVLPLLLSQDALYPWQRLGAGVVSDLSGADKEEAKDKPVNLQETLNPKPKLARGP